MTLGNFCLYSFIINLKLGVSDTFAAEVLAAIVLSAFWVKAVSVTTVAALALGLTEYDSEAIHGSRISASEVHRVTQELLTMTREQRATLGPMHEGRIYVIGSGALVLDRIMARTGLSVVVVSERDILDGIARALVSNPS